MAASKIKILEALAEASADDLAEIEAEIVKLEAKLASLKAAKSLVDVAVNGPRMKVKQVRAPRTPSAMVSGTTRSDADPATVASQVYDLIDSEGPLPIAVIAARLHKTPQGVALAATKSGWFARTAEGELAIAKA